nr:aminotransferase class V-fold PLP-dependent enzyme [Facklamia lactis]
MVMTKIYLASPHMSDEGYEMEYIQDAFKKNWIAPLGENVDQFEKNLAHMVGIKYSTALVSGTAAIHLALMALGVGAGDVVFCQNLTFSATVNPVCYLNAEPVFIDSEKDSWNMDPVLLEEAFQKYKPKAVIAVHLYGLSAKIDEIKQICEKYEVPLIEDAAESLGTIYKGQWTGTFGDLGIFSFNGNKIITTSGGGMLVSNDGAAIKKARFWATQAREIAVHYEHKEIGYNYRMSNIVAGIGRGQLKVLEQRVQQKRYIFQRYVNGLSSIPEIEFVTESNHERANYWLSAILINSTTISPKDVWKALKKENIESRPIWKPMHLQPVFNEFDVIGGSRSESFYRRGLCLPSDTKMTDEDLDKIIEIIKEVWS